MVSETSTSKATILVVEDEQVIASAVAQRLTAEGWRVEVARDGLTAVDAAARIQPDAIVLDVMLPGIDGLEVTRRIQAERPVPILMLTARDDETDMLIGLGIGADDYMTKPFSMRELVARLKALLRRVERTQQATVAAPSEPPLMMGDLVIDKAQRRVHRAGVEAHLTPTEFELLVMLSSSPKTVLTREQLLAEVWDWADASGTRTVDSHIKALRRKLGSDMIRTVHGVGYAFEPPTHAMVEPA
ncbi:MAG: response regulator transcription factor [Promicromonosporaceae bacterium]|nr:response regulator transcription factor [Promicromonosporaceae bacterium]